MIEDMSRTSDKGNWMDLFMVFLSEKVVAGPTAACYRDIDFLNDFGNESILSFVKLR